MPLDRSEPIRADGPEPSCGSPGALESRIPLTRLRRALTEAPARLLSYRKRSLPAPASDAEEAMSRAIPRILAHVSVLRPWMCIDLGCGTGNSTWTLLRHAPAGSRCLGYDIRADRLRAARERDHRDAGDRPAQVDFVQQSVLETLCDPTGQPLPEDSVDVVHSSRLVGHHFDTTRLATLGAELHRVVHTDGTVILDAGPSLHVRDMLSTMRGCGFRRERVLRFGRGARRCLVAFRPA